MENQETEVKTNEYVNDFIIAIRNSDSNEELKVLIDKIYSDGFQDGQDDKEMVEEIKGDKQ